jgi:hypothetical protein
MSVQSIKTSFRFINATTRPSSLFFTRQFHARSAMSAQVPSSNDISAVAKDENGPVKGSQSAEMQSQVGRAQVSIRNPFSSDATIKLVLQNFESAAQDVVGKMKTDPDSITSDDANYLKSREARATGQAQPPKGSVSAEAQRLASANEKGTTAQSTSQSTLQNTTQRTGPLNPSEQSQLTKERNFEQAVDQVASKMQNDPAKVTEEDANLLHSREHRARGSTEKGGIAAQAQSIASENSRS